MTDTSDREIVITRLLDAPRELVFAAYTDPRHAAHWWGPDGFTLTTHQHDLRPGGVWRFIMHGPDGRDYKNITKFIEVTPPERLVYAHAGEDETADISFHTTVTFEQRGNQTHLTMRSVFPSAEAREHVVREFGAIEGGYQHLARLAEYLPKMQAKE